MIIRRWSWLAAALVLPALGIAQEPLELTKLKRAAGRSALTVSLRSGEVFRERLRDVDSGQMLVFRMRGASRSIACADVRTVEFELASRWKKRWNTYAGLATLTLPGAVALPYGTDGSAAAMLVWPGSLAWAYPLAARSSSRSRQSTV